MVTVFKINQQADYKDNYQDYDIVFVVTETTSFVQELKKWLQLFSRKPLDQNPSFGVK